MSTHTQLPLFAAPPAPVWTCFRCGRPSWAPVDPGYCPCGSGSWAGQTLRPSVARALIEAQLDDRGELQGAA